MTEAATRDHRNIAAAGCDHRPQHQRSHIADATSGMFINNRAIQMQAFPVENGS
ncbi:Uncharacterised protein [Shigella sonnei]|nr:Uncharacterised protein [Shigella sonnei]